MAKLRTASVPSPGRADDNIPKKKKEKSFSVFSLITHEGINILLLGVFMILEK